MNDPELNEAFRRLSRGERFAPADPTREEAEALLNGEPTQPHHGSADGGAGYERPAPGTRTLSELFYDLSKGH